MIVGRIFLYAVVAFAFAARSAASLMVRDQAPDFTAMAVVDGKFEQVTLSELYESRKVRRSFTYPFDFTFVCPTEILTLSEKAKELKAGGGGAGYFVRQPPRAPRLDSDAPGRWWPRQRCIVSPRC